jgi:hypothetical protein
MSPVVSQLPRSQRCNIDPIHSDLTARRPVKTEQKAHKRTLARTGVTREKGHGTRREVQTHIPQGFMTIVIAARDP